MNAAMYKRLKQVTPEEQRILDGYEGVQWDIYTDDSAGGNHIVDYKKLMNSEKSVYVRKHTRFVYFPMHTHNYIEVFYVYSGSVTHIINGKKVIVNKGEFLFMNQHMQHAILPCGENDLAINIIIMPSFFSQIIDHLGRDNLLESEMLASVLQREGSDEIQPYIYFPVNDNLCVQNVVDNIFYAVQFRMNNLEPILLANMELLFLYLISDAEQIYVNQNEERENFLIMTVNRYIEEKYQTGTLKELSELTQYSVSTLSRLIKKYTGTTFKKLQSDQRMQAAVELLLTTNVSVSEIALSVGYENLSFFYKRFQTEFGETPSEMRKRLKKIRVD